MNLHDLRLLFRNSFKFDKPAELRNHHSFFTLQSTRQRRSVVLFTLPFHVIPDLAIRTFTIPAKVTVRDRVDRKILKTAQQTVLLRNADFVAHYLETYQLLVRIEQIRRAIFRAAASCTLFTHRQRQYNRSLLQIHGSAIAAKQTRG